MKHLEMAIGDLNSQEKGSGARAHTNKPNWSLLPLTQISKLMLTVEDRKMSIELYELTALLGIFQEQGTVLSAFSILEYGTRYFMETTDSSFDEVMHSVIKVWEFGAKKYNEFNWMKGMPWSVPLACAQRHIMAMLRGDIYDPESGQHHAAHFICNAIMLVHYTQYYKEGNDLPVQWFTE